MEENDFLMITFIRIIITIIVPMKIIFRITSRYNTRSEE